MLVRWYFPAVAVATGDADAVVELEATDDMVAADPGRVSILGDRESSPADFLCKRGGACGQRGHLNAAVDIEDVNDTLI